MCVNKKLRTADERASNFTKNGLPPFWICGKLKYTKLRVYRVIYNIYKYAHIRSTVPYAYA